jgi:hypothetical protein
MDQLTNIILPRYEEGKKIYDKVSSEIAALLDSIANDTDSRQEDLHQPFVCGQPLMCAEEEEMKV